MRYVSIAKDFYYETSASTLSYYITCNGRTVYWGISVKPSYAVVNRINIRQRIADYLDIDMPDFRDYDGVVIPHPEQLRDFELYSSDGTLLETYRALLGYYDEWDGSDVVQSDPVNGHTDPRQKIFYGECLEAESEIEIDFDGALKVRIDTENPIRIRYDEDPFDIHYESNMEVEFSYEGDWFTATEENGTIHIIPTINETGEERTGSICFTAGWQVQCFSIIQDAYEEVSEYLVFDILTNGNIRWNAAQSEGVVHSRTIEYSRDSGSTWTQITSTTDANPTLIQVNEGDTLLFRGNEPDYGYDGEGDAHINASSFRLSTAQFNVRGNIMSLLGENKRNEKWFCNLFTESTVVDASGLVLPSNVVDNAFTSMFSSCRLLKKAPKVFPARTLKRLCYMNMFNDCTSLTEVPVLKANAMAEDCYYGMFSGCTSITNAPALNSLHLATRCYGEMFAGCLSLKTAPKLPATTLANNSYERMFKGCISLFSAPKLKSVSLADSCYGRMFEDCTALVSPPELPSTSLENGCYYGMFIGCTSLASAPDLPSDVLEPYCYYGMFSGCTSLSKVKCLATDMSAAYCLTNWMAGVSQDGVFTKRIGAEWWEGDGGIPAGWEIVEV